MRIETRLKRRILNLLLKGFSLRSNGVFIARRSVVGASTVIGTGSRINGPVFIRGAGRLSIGNYCAFGFDIRFVTSNHSVSTISLQHFLQKQAGKGARHSDKMDIRVGHDVWIGDRAMILPGVTIGDGAVIGGVSVVTKSVEPYSIWAGNPARKIGERFTPDVVAALSELQWWHWSPERVKKQAEMLATDLAGLTDDKALALIRSLQEADNATS